MCEDFPACGHERGCCPDFDESGRQLNMKCTCGATVPLSSRSSLCESCLNAPDEDGFDDRPVRFEDEEDDDFDDDHFDESMDGDHESGLASAGYGTDEDYGYYGQEDQGLTVVGRVSDETPGRVNL